ncbi:MAG TPA: hypothetical protein VEU62_03610 [Bryobacterales bacterium]|nr:hypothetical protein [Bryobacterales bacterium]
MSVEEVRRKAQEFQAKVRRRNLELFAVVIVIALLGWQGLLARHVHLGERLVSGLIIAAVLYVAYQLYQRGPAGVAPPDATFDACLHFHRAELERQREALQRIWSWYLGPVLGALLAFASRGLLAHLDQPREWWRMVPFVVLAVLWSFALGTLTNRAAGKPQHEIDALAAAAKHNS